MLNFGYLGGTLYYDTTPLCKFKFVNGHFNKRAVEIFCTAENLRPYLIDDYTLSFGWQIFLEEQITPASRQNILVDLAEHTPIRGYNPEQILRYTKGRNAANLHWIMCDRDYSCWSLEQRKILMESGDFKRMESQWRL